MEQTKDILEDPRPELGLRRVINVAGNMTSLGASIARPEVIEAVSRILPHFVEIDDLQRRASGAIAEATGAEAGCVTACAAAGVSIGIAGAMTGANLAAIEALPRTDGLRDAVVMMAGQVCHYSAPIDQAVRLTGAQLRTIGTVNEARPDQLEHALEGAAAMHFVVSHQTVQHGQIALAECARLCKAAGVPLIVDAAAESDLRTFIDQGADLVVYSAHKVLGGMTGGIVAGRKDLVRAAYLQSAGIGRGMKVGKEGIAGVIAALEVWAKRDHAAEQVERERVLALWRDVLAKFDALDVAFVDDPTGNSLRRLSIGFDRFENATAADIATHLSAREPAIIVRDEFLDLNRFELDPCNLHPGEDEEVAGKLTSALTAAVASPMAGKPASDYKAASFARRLQWPD